MTELAENQAVERERLKGLLEFSRGLLLARSGTLMDMEAPRLLYLPESKLSDLRGLTLNSDDGTWFKLQRQRPGVSPSPPENIRLWIKGDLNEPSTQPALHMVQVIDVSLDEASDLCQGGIVLPEDIHEWEPGDDVVKLAIHLENLSERRAEIDNWIQSTWKPWAEDEKQTRKSIKIYNQIFKLYNQMHGGADTPPELIWGMGVVRWSVDGEYIHKPLIEQAVDLDIEEDGSLLITPRNVPPSMDMQPFHQVRPDAGARAQGTLDATFRLIVDDDNPITPFVYAQWEHVLEQAAGLLDSNAQFISHQELSERDGGGIEVSDVLTITSEWVIYARPRTTGALLDDLRIMGECLCSDHSVRAADAMLGFVRDLSAEVDNGVDPPTAVPVGGASGADNSSWTNPEPSDAEATSTHHPGYFFPLPFNVEQARIVDELESHPVVSVTGPPGTGKTHTIANIIAHYMATGRRVLVTARTAEAIAAVRDKLPDDLASLVITSAGSDREATRQLEAALERLSDEVVSLDVQSVRSEAQTITSRIVEIDKEIQQLNNQYADIARQNIEPLVWDGEELPAMDLLDRLQASAADHEWFTDRPDTPPPSDLGSTVEELRSLVPGVGDAIEYLDGPLPDTAGIPTVNALIGLHQSMRQESDATPPVATEYPTMAVDSAESINKAQGVLKLMEYVHEKLPEYRNTPWFTDAIRYEIHARCNGRPGSGILEPIQDIGHQLESLDLQAVSYQLGDADIAEFQEAIDRACAGAKPLSVFARMSNKPLVDAVASIRVAGAGPSSRQQWDYVARVARIDSERPQYEAAWDKAYRHLPLQRLPASAWECIQAVKYHARLFGKVSGTASKLYEAIGSLDVLFPVGMDIRGRVSSLDFQPIIDALKHNLDLSDPIPAARRDLQQLAGSVPGSVGSQLHTLLESLGSAQTSDQQILEQRNRITHTIAQIEHHRPELNRIDALLRTLSDSGAPQWSDRLRHSDDDCLQLIPQHWYESWLWAFSVGKVQNILALGNGDDCLSRKRDLEESRRNLLRELIRLKTLLGLKPRISDQVQSALFGFTNAVQMHGAGTGANAPRWRRIIQDEAQKASPAAPVWVMPEYKVVERLPKDIASFDLVILDEASQCDLTSMASLMRGRRCLIVGDEKQVSPASVGITVNRINALRAQHLADLPKADQIQQDTSIFDLARQMFPASHLMLREHFRCVEPIIRYSDRFYHDRLIPLRVSRESERFDPPLVDMYIAGATLEGKTNPAEAQVIVDEIAAISRDPTHHWRDIAVISLLGREQSEYIERELMADERIGAEVMNRHRIICGDARTLQGQERSIVFLSMVAVPKSVRAQTAKDMEQRLNVAMSRARDRLYLVRSVQESDLRTRDLKAGVLQHFKDPMSEGGTSFNQSTLDRCESGFEKEVCQRLMDANYRTRSQVRAGSYKIDLVVEGAEDKRLAIELDGDRWHSPDRWHEDMRRQASLERAGWTFWRVFGSQWLSNKEHYWNDLLSTLYRLGIGPIGGTASDEVFSELREFEVHSESGRVVVNKPAEKSSDDSDLSTSDTDGDHAEPSIDITAVDIDLEPEEDKLTADADADADADGGSETSSETSADNCDQDKESVEPDSEQVDQGNRDGTGSSPGESPDRFRPQDVSAKQIKDTLLTVLADLPNNSCKYDDATKLVLQRLGILTRGSPWKAFASKTKRAIKDLIRAGKIEQYQATNQRIRLKKRT